MDSGDEVEVCSVSSTERCNEIDLCSISSSEKCNGTVCSIATTEKYYGDSESESEGTLGQFSSCSEACPLSPASDPLNPEQFVPQVPQVPQDEINTPDTVSAWLDRNRAPPKQHYYHPYYAGPSTSSAVMPTIPTIEIPTDPDVMPDVSAVEQEIANQRALACYSSPDPYLMYVSRVEPVPPYGNYNMPDRGAGPSNRDVDYNNYPNWPDERNCFSTPLCSSLFGQNTPGNNVNNETDKDARPLTPDIIEIKDSPNWSDEYEGNEEERPINLTVTPSYSPDTSDSDTSGGGCDLVSSTQTTKDDTDDVIEIL